MSSTAENGIVDEAFRALEEQLQTPLLGNQPADESKPTKSPGQKAIRRTFKGTAHLANLLPTGSVLAFQIMSPGLTHEGKCNSIISQFMTLGLVGLCSISCFFLCFTDSIRDDRGKVRYVMATFNGLWVVDGSINVSPEVAAKYKINFIDFFHAFMSILVFGAVAMFDQNVINCFYPNRSDEFQEFLTALPVFVGIVCSLLFVAFPTKRHGIGFPLSRD